MKQLSLAFLIAVSFSLQCKETVKIPSFCERYHQRSYLILRLRQAAYLLKKHNPKAFHYKINPSNYRNSHIQATIKKIEQELSLQPFFTLWNKLAEYKHLEESNYASEFTHLLLEIQKLVKEPLVQFSSKSHAPLTLTGTTYTEVITARNYYSKRLKKTIALLSKIKCSQQDLFDPLADTTDCDCVFIHDHLFSSPPITRCVSEIEREKTLQPLLQLTKNFYKYIQQQRFLREFIFLIFIATRNIIMNNAIKKKITLKKSIQEDINYIYRNLDAVTVEEILEVIDILTEELPALLEQYNFYSTKTWRAWLKKYWWAPPLIGTVLGLRIYWVVTHPSQKPPENPLLPKPNSSSFLLKK